jgi:hypothetical protein
MFKPTWTMEKMGRWAIQLENKITIVAELQRSQFSNMPWNYLLVMLSSTENNDKITH